MQGRDVAIITHGCLSLSDLRFYRTLTGHDHPMTDADRAAALGWRGPDRDTRLKEREPVYKDHKISWIRAFFLGMFHGGGLAALAFPFHWNYLPILVGMYLWMGFGTTLYLHRM